MSMWNHQTEALEHAMPLRAVMLPLGMGTGKSRVVVELVTRRQHKKTLILCPLSVLNVWTREFRKWGDGQTDVVVLEGKATRDKAKNLAGLLEFAKLSPRKLVVCINYDSAWRADLAAVLLRAGWDLVVCDEVHRIKAPGGKASRFAAKLGKVAKHRLGLTGTPMPHSPLDVYSQYRFLDPSIYGTSFAAFRSRYAICDRMFPSKVLKWINQDDLNQRFYSIACRRIQAADVLDLPPVQHIERWCTLPAKAMKVYRDLEDDLIAEVEAGTIAVNNALTRLLRLQQIAAGFVSWQPDDPEEDLKVETLHDEKETLLCDMLADLPLGEPVVVFCRFRRDLDAVAACAARTGRIYRELSGRRRDLTSDATLPPEAELFGTQIQSGGVGVDFTRAAYAVFWDQTWSVGEFDQACARLDRPGQTRPVRFYHLLAAGTVDLVMRKALESKRQVVEAVLETLTRKDGAVCPSLEEMASAF